MIIRFITHLFPAKVHQRSTLSGEPKNK